MDGINNLTNKSFQNLFCVDKLKNLKTLITLRQNKFNPKIRSKIEKWSKTASKINSDLSNLQQRITEEEKNVEKLSRLLNALKTQNKTLETLQKNVPDALKDNTLKDENDTTKIPRDEKDPPNNPPNDPKHKIPNSPILPDKKRVKSSPDNHKEWEISPNHEEKENRKTFEMISIKEVTLKEFEELPNYLNRNLTVEKINQAITEIEKILTRKYRILACPEDLLEKKEIIVKKSYLAQENKNTRGEVFFMDSDLKNAVFVKLNSVGKKILSALKHLQRVNFLPGSNHRYALFQ